MTPPAQTAEELVIEAYTAGYKVGLASRDDGFYPYKPETLIQAERQRAAEWEEVAVRAEKDRDSWKSKAEAAVMALEYYVEQCAKEDHLPCDCLQARMALKETGGMR